jgi:hypothetical protein
MSFRVRATAPVYYDNVLHTPNKRPEFVILKEEHFHADSMEWLDGPPAKKKVPGKAPARARETADGEAVGNADGDAAQNADDLTD